MRLVACLVRVSPAALEVDLYSNRWAPFKGKNRQLKQDLHAKEELTLYKRKTASWKGVHVKKAETFAHAHSTREDSSDSITFSNLKRFEGGTLFQSFYNRGKYDFAKFVSNCLNSEVSSDHLDKCASFAFLVLYVISGFSVLDTEKGETYNET